MTICNIGSTTDHVTCGVTGDEYRTQQWEDECDYLTVSMIIAAVTAIIITADSADADTRNRRMLCVSELRTTGVADRRA